MNRDEFLRNESASRDTIDFKRIYVDMATDLVAGLLLSQIVFWYLPNKKTGTSKLRVYHEGHYWIAKRREDWWDECRISPKQFDRASAILEELGLIVIDTFKFNGSPTKHIRLEWDNFIARYNDELLKSYRVENESSPNGKIEIDQTVKSITETTAENTNTISPDGEKNLLPSAMKNRVVDIREAKLVKIQMVHSTVPNVPRTPNKLSVRAVDADGKSVMREVAITENLFVIGNTKQRMERAGMRFFCYLDPALVRLSDLELEAR